MSYITWKTKAGSLGVIAHSEYVEYTLAAIDSNASQLEFTCIAGKPPLGMRIDKAGVVKGVPVIEATGPSKSVTSSFTVRANTPAGVIADRSFAITVHNHSQIKIAESTTVLGAFDDGTLISHQFTAISDNPAPTLTWSIVDGELPIDILTGIPIQFTSAGLLTGHIGQLIDLADSPHGYDMSAENTYPYDFSPISKDRAYTFTIKVFDGFTYSSATVRINVVSKGSLTADNTITVVNNTLLTVDASSNYAPVITTDVTVIPTLTSGNNFSFKFDAFDPNFDEINWKASDASEMAAAGMSISAITGWMSGTVPAQSERTKTYAFSVNAFKAAAPHIQSLSFPVSITVMKDSTNYISWISPAQLGTITNGTVSEFSILATSNTGKNLIYELQHGKSCRLPQGLKLLPNGFIIGKCSFRYFSLDGANSTITVASTTGIQPGMDVMGPGVAAGCKVVAIIDRNSVNVSPAVFISAGAELIFSDVANNYNVTTQLTDLSTTTSIDGNKTTFDQTYKFSVLATAEDASISDFKEFTITVDNFNKAPYEDLYLRALPSVANRAKFDKIINDDLLIPPELIYRPSDPNFGKATDVKFLFAAGLSAATLEQYATSISENHYRKQINFSNIKTARALDENFCVRYEVVYVEVGDDKQANGVSSPLVVNPEISIPYYYDDQQFTTLYPNSFDNMEYRLNAGVGYTHRGALPSWMTSRQSNGRVLGLVKAVVLAYVLPGASSLVAFRLREANVNFNEIQFIADRYQITAGNVQNYDVTLNKFVESESTVFDLSGESGISGLCSCTPNSTTVTGVGTRFKSEVTKGDRLYTQSSNTLVGWVRSVVSDSELHLEIATSVAALSAKFTVSSDKTTFDMTSTQFSNNKDIYAAPESGDKYIKFTQTGVYR